MNPWGYKRYLDSVNNDMNMGANDMGFSRLQAFSFAHNELAARLEEFPSEGILALTALATCLSEYYDLEVLEENEDFLIEFKGFIDGKVMEKISLESEDQRLFVEDLKRVKSVFGW